LQCCVSDESDIDFGSNPYYYDHWCGAEDYALTYLDDKYCQKKFPSQSDREWTCPVFYDAAHTVDAKGFSADSPLAEVEVDVQSLAAIVDPAEANICISLTRRTADGLLYNKYVVIAPPLASSP
jgi:hypothetical protein